MGKDKVEITINEGEKYVESVKNGAEFISVEYSGRGYGGASPCDNEKEIKEAIKSAKEEIRKHGDIPIVNDTREGKGQLNLDRF